MTVTLHESKHSGYTEISGINARLHPSLSSASTPVELTDESLETLARLAEPEPWKTATLRDYLHRTLDRLQRQQKVAGNLFNTGLATPVQEAVVGLLVPGGPRWLPETDPAVPAVPPLATYGESPAEFVYDVRRELVVGPKQLLAVPENLAVLPGPLPTNPYQAGLVLEGAVRRAEARVRRSYRVAVPGWDPAAERVHLLLPLSLTTPETVDVALAVIPEGEGYRGTAILPLDVAYAQARQIARPVGWP